MPDTLNLILPYLEAAQAQKHVTVNDALSRLDALVHLAVVSRVVATPPASPVDGDRYLIPVGATGVWAAQIGKIALRLEGAWTYATPREGWQLWVSDENLLLAYDGAAWLSSSVPSTLQNLQMLGVNATADVTNKFAVSSSATLFNHAGNGHQMKFNKNAAADTASLLWQTGFSGRAEMGTTGDDKLHMKVSADGTTFTEMLVADAASDRLSFPRGVALVAQTAPATSVDGQIWHDSASGTLRARMGGSQHVLAPLANPQVQLSETTRGLLALENLPVTLRDRKALIVDFASGGFSHVDDGLGNELRSIENVPGLAVSNASGGKRISRKRRLDNIAANSLRYSYVADTGARGVLFERAHSYLNKQSQPTVAQLDEAVAVSDSSAPAGWSGNWIALGDNTVLRRRRVNVSVVTGNIYYVQFLIRMSDGSAPVAADFDVTIGADIVRHPDTAAVGVKISSALANGVYIVQAYTTATVTGNVLVGVSKLTTNSVKTFSVGLCNIGPGRYAPSLYDNATATPNSRTADRMSIPISGFIADGLTIFGSLAAPRDTNATDVNGIVGVLDGASSADSFLRLYFYNSLVPRFGFRNGAAAAETNISMGGSLVAGSVYRFAVALDRTTNTLNSKFTGLGAFSSAGLSTFDRNLNTLVLGGDHLATNQLNSTLEYVGLVDRAWSTAEILSFTG